MGDVGGCEKRFDAFFEQGKNLVKERIFFVFGAGRFGWVGNAPMQCLRSARKDRAGFAGGLIADGDDEIKGRIRHVTHDLLCGWPGSILRRCKVVMERGCTFPVGWLPALHA